MSEADQAFVKGRVDTGIRARLLAKPTREAFKKAVEEALFASSGSPNNDKLDEIDISGYDTVHFDGIFGNMQIREGECHVIARPFTVVCSPSGLFIVAKQVRCPTQSLLMSLSGHVPQMLGPTDMWGFPLPLTEDCPDLAFMLPAIHDTPPQPIIDALTWKDTDSGWDVHTTEEQLHTYIRFCREVGLLTLVESLGWQMVVVPPGVDYRPAWCVTFRPAVHSPSVSKPQFRSICTATIAQALFPPETSDSKAIRVALKPWDTWHPVRSWPRDTLVEALLKPWQQASRHTGAQFLLRALHGGRQMTNEHQLGTYIPVTHSNDEGLKIHFVMQQHGGGSKLDAHHRLKQQAVEFLLQWGANPADVNPFVQELYEKAGMSRFQHTMAIKDGEEKFAQIKRLSQAMHVKVPQFEDLQEERQKKFKTWRPKPFMDQTFIRAGNFSIATKSFAYGDGSDAPFVPCTSAIREGVMLANADCVGDIVRALASKPKAFAICVVGAECPGFDTSCQAIHVPALDKQGAQVIIKACLHQFGTEPIRLRTTSGDDVAVQPSCLSAITAWKSEMKAETWALLLGAPAKTCAQVLCITPADHYSTSPWGRTFRNEDKTCGPEEAQSFQFHCRIKSSALELLMKHSGQEGVYLTPKSETLNRFVSLLQASMYS